jgi:pyruvate kinase
MNKSNFKKVKIVSTLGPKSDSPEMVEKLAIAGVDVFRFNFSHCPREEAFAREKSVRAAEKNVGRKLAILADLMGPKLRISKVTPDPTVIVEGEYLDIIFGEGEGDGKRIFLTIPNVLENLEKGDEVYLGDGDIKLIVAEKVEGGVRTKIAIGGDLRGKMGFQAKTLSLAPFEFSEKDRNDLKTALDIKADSIAISFVQTADDVKLVKSLIPKEGHQPFVIVKIETMAGFENAEKIMQVADGLMIARGDLGFAAPIAELPIMQKELINLCMSLGKPVITATQMLESMTWNSFPTRAEITDVANAIFDGTDAVMTSGETAKGKHPELVVQTMADIVSTAQNHVVPHDFDDESAEAQAITNSVTRVADQIGARLIIVFTETGRSARLISRHRPHQNVIALSPNEKTLHELSFSWGVLPKQIEKVENVNAMIAEAQKVALDNPIVKLEKGEAYVIAAGIPFGESGSTNMVVVQRA